MSPRYTFARKAVAAALLVLLADRLFYGEWVGATLGAFALIWVATLLVGVPALRRGLPAAVLGIAAALGVVMVDDPNLLTWLLFWTAVASAALLPRHGFDDAARWGARLLTYPLLGLARPLVDAGRLTGRRLPGGCGRTAALLALPVAGTLVFGALFALANPLIGNALDAIAWPSLWSMVFHLLFWGAVLATVWPSFRPRTVRLDGLDGAKLGPLDLPVATLVLSLAAFNLLFALQNGLDLAFLWSGAPLPAGVTLADYAHRGAYTLIATALLAGAFVLLTLSPGSRAARSRPVRGLVLLWVAQNVLLVASSMLRLLDYVAAYSLTELRIAALLWMVLVAVGLVLVVVRLMTGRSAAWLLNANAAAVAVVLLGSSAVDFGAVAARWNVAQARSGDDLDLCYLHRLGPAALLPLIDLERRAGGPELRDRARYLRVDVMRDLVEVQSDWHGWTWRNARRLAAARALTAGTPEDLRPAPYGRDCDGSRNPPPPQPAPLTGGTQP